MITTLLEKKGVHKNIDNDKLDFKEMIEKLILINIQIINGFHTYNNKIGQSKQIAIILDRFLVSKEFFQNKMSISTEILPFSRYDHWPINLQWESNQTP